MTTIHVEKINEIYLHYYCNDMGVEAEIVDFFTFEVPGAKFMPMYKAKIWDGKKRLADPIRKTLYVGLFDYLKKFAERREYDLKVGNDIGVVEDIDLDDVEEFIDQLNLHGNGNKIEVRDYQLDAIQYALLNGRCVLLSPTGSGKSLIIYSISRWSLNQGRRVLLLTPNVGLVQQMYSDFKDYSSANGWDTDEHCQMIYSGFPKQVTKDITISTWQSVYKMSQSWFDQFDVILGDEAHLFKAQSLSSIMEKMTRTKYRIGTTGSLDNKLVHELALTGMFGPVYRVTTTKKLQDEGKLAGLKIHAILLKHTQELRQVCKKASYQDEMDLIVTNQQRNKFIRNLAVSTKGNTLVLFQYVDKHGSILYNMIKDKAPERKVYFIHGKVEADDREQIRKILSTETNSIVIASYGTTAHGINIPSIENLIFASPSKSIIRVLQSVGRGLRLNKDKTHCNLFDLTDDLSYKSHRNHTLEHGAERYKIYTKEQFDIKLSEVQF